MRAISHLVCTMPFSECSAPVPQYVNRGLLNFGANGWQRGWGGCGCTLNGKPALLCAVVMAGDYLAKQKDWMNAPLQIGRTPSLFPTIASLPFLTFIIYVRPGSDLNALIMVPLRLGDIWQLDRVLVWPCILFYFFSPTPPAICYDEVVFFCNNSAPLNNVFQIISFHPSFLSSDFASQTLTSFFCL